MKQVCNLCPRKCGALRTEHSGNGFCKMGLNPVCARAALHFWEEPVISGSKGSGTVFFSGCTLGCVFCQNRVISNEDFGQEITPKRLSEIFYELENQGAHNINLVTPSHFVPAIVKAFQLYRPSIPVVYNCGGYESEVSIDMISPYVDIWLPDFKYSDSSLAKKLSLAENYPEIAKKAIKKMASLSPEVIIENGIMKKGVIARHLILPSHTKNSIGVLDILDEMFPQRNVLVSLMSQYTPTDAVKNQENLCRCLTKREYQKVRAHLFELDFDGFVQDLSSAKEEYTPEFNLEGI